ncbi:succinylglutamate desuccinylase/aspartoacylase domain-containing protein [Niveispirillum fermenti]|uniref:succinylglutamate desuccinylase/aspartoacylase domain-containing protein n=1 Tax=Niveispirillum fermenti TaxID=1233113 RepID=UPI003A840C05
MARIEPLAPGDLWPPDITGLVPGNDCTDHVYRFDAAVPGPHVLVNALMHGNEVCGAVAVATLLRAGIRPCRGSLTFSFANVEAFNHLDPQFPVLSRYMDEDMNRVWAPDILAGSGDSIERRRARSLWPLFAEADFLLDLHSMQHDTIPLMLAGRSARGRALAGRLGMPGFVVMDGGHAGGLRLIDHPRFTDGADGPVALLAECGRHQDRSSARTALAVTARFLAVTGAVATTALSPWLPSAEPPPPRFVEVTETVTVCSEQFRFLQDFKGMDIIPRAGTGFAVDAGRLLRTPHDDCVMIMPARVPMRGQTAVRLGRFRS